MDDFRNGHVNWNNWSFDYLVADTEGLCLLDGYYAGRKIFKKLSLPVIRVKYVKDGSHIPYLGSIIPDGCGPYADHIQWVTAESIFGHLSDLAGSPHHLVRMQKFGDQYVGMQEFIISDNGISTKWMEIGVYARIGEYHIYMVYYLSDRLICPRIYSRGLACNLQHVHHPYWRFDFDLDGTDNQRVLLARNNNYAAYYDLEGMDVMAPNSNTRWGVQNITTKATAWVFPDLPPHDGDEQGAVDAFSVMDANIRIYRPEEDCWPFHTNELDFQPQVNPDGKDVVLWFVSHLLHIPDGTGDPWHCVGPTIVLVPPEPAVPVPPESKRVITISADISITHAALLKKDVTTSFHFTGTVLLEEYSYYNEIVFETDPVAETTRAKLALKFTWNADYSVAADYVADLFIHADDGDQEMNHFNILKNHHEDLTIHMKSGGLEPDTAIITISLGNKQQL